MAPTRRRLEAAFPHKVGTSVLIALFNNLRHTRETHEKPAEFAIERLLARVARVSLLLRYRFPRVGDVRAARAVHPQGYRDVSRRTRLPGCGSGAWCGHPASDARQSVPGPRRPARRVVGYRAVGFAFCHPAAVAVCSVLYVAARARRVCPRWRCKLRRCATDGRKQLSTQGAGPRA